MANFLTAPSFSRPASSHSNAAYLTSDSSDTDNDDTPLPFPAALVRSDFLAPTFQPTAYLSALSDRHQTLEDLRSDLRERSAAVSAELLELVNSNYTAFLSLGNELRGGDEKVEDVRVALLGFRRATEEVKSKVTQRREKTQALNEDLKDVRAQIEQGRMMLEVSERLTALEEKLALHSAPKENGNAGWYTDDSDEDDDDDDEDDKPGEILGSSPAKLLGLAQECSRTTVLVNNLDQGHRFVFKLNERLMRCRNTLLLDLGNALKQAKKAGPKGQDRLLRYLGIYRILDAQSEGVKALRDG
ncbi:hypothetical protein S40285_02284 [Stachybotrys chlorohalonatus IBT 40285]|jgi:hypothetical protein|uniref:Conserved oligomeric Golgi complex subunit 2 n=1 Tax=Stachybotrys chlorohalonatus (strain IBT 40285) TaxID=1283841 RepID=A0A084QFW5_STAC4|nr:hypothetical protein S40285_02284 [Stachybotrys chlorohalonata IBT 40285]